MMNKRRFVITVILGIVGCLISILIYRSIPHGNDDVSVPKPNTVLAAVPNEDGLMPAQVAPGSLPPPPPGGWNIFTNAEGSYFHRDGTNLWWLGGAFPSVFTPNMVNLPGSEAFQEAIAASAVNPSGRERKLRGFEGINRQDIAFYGVAVDQDTNALAGATVHALVTVRTLTSEREEKLKLVTGPDGRFVIDGVAGESLGVTVTKTNYHFAPTQLFHYSLFYGASVHQPDPNKPVVFRLDKVQQADSLTYFKRWIGVPNTGEPVRIDFATGQVVQQGGDLIVSIECLEKFEFGNPVPWRMRLEAVGGGFAPSDAGRLEWMYEAPPAGYQPLIEVSYGHEGEGFGAQFDGLFYIMSRGGRHYAKVRFDMNISWDERGVPFGIQCYVNTNASRVLEVDPAKLTDLNADKPYGRW